MDAYEVLKRIPIPAGQIQVMGTTVIPGITSEMGRNWDQPTRNEITFQLLEETNKPLQAYMNQAALDALKEYSSSLPSGVYEGKMWKGHWKNAEGNLVWYLCWYDYSETNRGAECSIKHCPVMLLEMLALVNPPE